MTIEAVIFIPGICGSVLMDGDRTIWPGTPEQVVFGGYPDTDVHTLANSTTLRATDVLRNVPLHLLGIDWWHFDGYGRALANLERLGFHESDGSLIPFAYDWRQDLRLTAQALRDRLSKPDLRARPIAIVAHSMGGLVARYMIETLGVPAGVTLSLCALVAVPHLGAPTVLRNILGLRPELFLNEAQCKVALANPAFPAAYQLLPHAGVPALLAPSPTIGLAVRDVFDPVVAAGLHLTPESLAAASAFGAGLQMMGPGFRPHCPYVIIAGNAQRTNTANYIVSSGPLTAIDEETGGDGTVPLWSAGATGVPTRYVAATHGGMFADDDAVAMLSAVLKPGTPGGRLFSLETAEQPPKLSAQAVELSVEAGGTLTVAVVADRPTRSIDAALHVERLLPGGGTTSTDLSIRYQGGPLRSLSIDVVAPDSPTALRISVVEGTHPAGEATTVLVLPSSTSKASPSSAVARLN